MHSLFQTDDEKRRGIMLPDASHESFLLGIRDPDHTHWKSSERSRIHSTRYHAPFPPGRGINSTPRCGCLERTASIQPSDNDMTTAHHRTHTSFASHTAKPQEKNIACQRRKIIFRRGTSWIGSLPTPLYRRWKLYLRLSFHSRNGAVAVLYPNSSSSSSSWSAMWQYGGGRARFDRTLSQLPHCRSEVHHWGAVKNT